MKIKGIAILVVITAILSALIGYLFGIGKVEIKYQDNEVWHTQVKERVIIHHPAVAVGTPVPVPFMFIPKNVDSSKIDQLFDLCDQIDSAGVEIIYKDTLSTAEGDTIIPSFNWTERRFMEVELRKMPVILADTIHTIMPTNKLMKPVSVFEKGLYFLGGVGATVIVYTLFGAKK